MPIWHQSPKLTPRYFLETPRLFGYPIIQLIKMNPKITQIELANLLNLSRSTIKRMLNRLQQQEILTYSHH